MSGFDLFEHELARIQVVYPWVREHQEEDGFDALLIEDNIAQFLVAPDCPMLWVVIS